MRMNGFFAITMALTAPVFWTIGIYVARIAFEEKTMSPWDLAVDTAVVGNLIFTVVFFVYLREHKVDWVVIAEAILAGVLFVFGRTFNNLAISKGPGGPV